MCRYGRGQQAARAGPDRHLWGLPSDALSAIIVLSWVRGFFGATGWAGEDEMTVPGYPLLLYVDTDPAMRRLADATFRGEYIVEAVASVEEMHDGIEPAVVVINLSDETDPQPVWDRLKGRWPTVPTVVVLTTEAGIEKAREALWALDPSSIVVNPFAPDAMRRGVTVALS